MAKDEASKFPPLNNILSRRQMIWGSAVGLSSVLVLTGRARGAVDPKRETSGNLDIPTSIHQEVDLKGSPQRVYEALLDSKQFSAFTGMAAEIHREPGGAFSCFDGKIVGRNVELVANQRIVQAWRSNGWPSGAYSIVRFELSKQDSGTRVALDHRGFPDGTRESLEAGWKSHYWEPLAKYLG